MRDDAKACDALVRSADVAAMSSDARDRSSSSVLGSWRSEFSSSNAYRTRLRKGRFFQQRLQTREELSILHCWLLPIVRERWSRWITLQCVWLYVCRKPSQWFWIAPRAQQPLIGLEKVVPVTWSHSHLEGVLWSIYVIADRLKQCGWCPLGHTGTLMSYWESLSHKP